MRTFEDFWIFYVRQHLNPTCRRLHFVGTNLTLAVAATGTVTSHYWLLLTAPLVGYTFAWIGHFVFEKNYPATFGHPLWSFRADFRMLRLIWLGQMSAEVERCNLVR